MSYCGGATQANANYLSSKTGLDPRVALAWLKNECQSTANPTNPLNILYYGTHGQIGQRGRFGTYASTQAGLDGAAWLVNNSGYYSGIRAAIKTGDPVAQARAIENSPWAGGHYGGAGSKDGGIVRTLAGIIGGIIKPLPNAKTVSSPGGSGSGGVAAPSWLNDPAHVITAADSDALSKYITSIQDPAQAGQLSLILGAIFHPNFGSGQTSYIGKTVGDFRTKWGDLLVPNSPVVKKTTDDTGLLGGVADAIAGVGDVLGKIAGLGVGVVLVALGVFLYGKSVSSRVVNVQ